MEIDGKAFDDVKAYEARMAALPPAEKGVEDDPTLPQACQLSWFECEMILLASMLYSFVSALNVISTHFFIHSYHVAPSEPEQRAPQKVYGVHLEKCDQNEDVEA